MKYCTTLTWNNMMSIWHPTQLHKSRIPRKASDHRRVISAKSDLIWIKWICPHQSQHERCDVRCHLANGSTFVREPNSCCADGPTLVRKFMRERGRRQQTPMTKKGADNIPLQTPPLPPPTPPFQHYRNFVLTIWPRQWQKQALVMDARRPWRIYHTRPIVLQ